MHNNYYFIRQLVLELKTKLLGFKLADAYSQNKDEAIFSFLKLHEEIHIIGHLTGQFTCVAFPTEYVKARKNTAEIFKSLIGKKVIGINGFTNERALAIDFEDEQKLVFKLFGRQANLLLYQQNQVIELFKKSYQTDAKINYQELDREISRNSEDLLKIMPNYRELYPTLDKKMVSYIDSQIAGKSPEQAVEIFGNIIKKYEAPVGYLINTEDKPFLEIAINEQDSNLVTSSLEAVTNFFFRYLKYTKQNRLKSRLLQDIDRTINKTEVYLAKVKRKARTIEHDSNYKLFADLLMAYLYKVPSNAKKVALPDFYDSEKIISIKLNERLSAQQNAERYYNKAKNLNLEIDNIKQSIKAKEELLKDLKEQKEAIENVVDFRSLQKYSKSSVSKVVKKEVPFKTFILGGYTIYVGNNAKQNDLLTLKFASKNDLFFHAKDVSGSHVILKQKPGSNVPIKILEATASIAAHYSKRKTDSLCPVAYTEKKYVRKPKGSPPGLVLIEKEKVLLVPPGLP